jgi:4-aminobutyrate aminotransferase
MAMDHLSSLSPVWPHYTPIIASHALGSYVYDMDGRQYLDFTCGIGVTNTGHCHPRIVEAVREQAGKLLHGQINIVVHEPILDLIAELNLRAKLPGKPT